jgi:hypothetical protein
MTCSDYHSPIWCYMFNNSDYSKLIIIQDIINFINRIDNIYQTKSLQFDKLVEDNYFTNVNIDKNIYWNQIKQYKIKLIKLKSFLNYFKKQFIIEASTFKSINDDCRYHISSFL